MLDLVKMYGNNPRKLFNMINVNKAIKRNAYHNQPFIQGFYYYYFFKYKVICFVWFIEVF